MRHKRLLPRGRAEKPEHPFETAAEAWFWSARALRARGEGARFMAGAAAFARPCDPDDVLLVALDLHRRRRLSDVQARALAHFGWREAPPDGRLAEDVWAIGPWDEALDLLAPPLRAKGIVA